MEPSKGRSSEDEAIPNPEESDDSSSKSSRDQLALVDEIDIAVLILDSPAPVKPIPWNRKRLDRSIVGTTIRAIGYGLTAPKIDPSGTNGVRRVMKTKITD